MPSSAIDHPHGLTREQVVSLLEERDVLRETVAQLEEKLRELVSPTGAALPRSWRLTRTEERFLLAFLKVGTNVLHRERLFLVLYGMFDNDVPQMKILDVYIYKIRRKLMEAQTQITIHGVWGRGWHLDADGLARLQKAIQDQDATCWTPGEPLMIGGSGARAA